jgi:hypothetical protein
MELLAGRGLHVMALLQGIRELFGPLLDDLDCVSSAIKDKQTSHNDFFAKIF